MPDPTPENAGMTKAELVALMKDTARDVVGPAIKAEIEPLAKSQTTIGDALAKLTAEHGRTVEFDKKILGKFPFGRMVRAIALANLDAGKATPTSDPEPGAILASVKRHWSPTAADDMERWVKHVKGVIEKTTLTAGTAVTAGDIVFPSYDTEWIELLRNNAVVRGICRTLPMPRGATSRRKQTGAGTAYYQGETDRITPSNQTVARVNLSYKKLTALTVVSNDLIRFSGGEADRIVQEDLLRVAALREDRAFLYANPPTAPDSGAPQGIRYQTAGANIAAAAGTSLANFQSDLTTMVNLVETANVLVSTDNGYFIMSPGLYWTIYALATTTGDWVFRDELRSGKLLGYNLLKTTQLSNAFLNSAGVTTVAGTTGSNGMLFFVYAPGLEIHDSMQRTISTYVGGAYYDPSLAAVASGITNDETVITCIGEHDFLQVYPLGASIRTGYAV